MQSFKSFLAELNKPKELDQLRKTLSKTVTSVDSRNDKWTGSITDVMKAYDFKKLGSGKYGSVYGNAKYPYVIKVFMKDSAYIRWIKFCMSNQDNKYIPKIKGKVIKLTPFVYAIRLEKLTPTSMSGPFNSAYSKWMADSSYRDSDSDINDILDNFTENKKLLDLHSENVMARGKQLVVIDPYYNWFNKHKSMDFTIDPNELDISVF